MSISGQQAINIGLPNESINSDSLYTAFTKANTNFNTLFACASPFTNFVSGVGISTLANANSGTITITNTGVTSIVAGTNIAINRSNGAVTISATGGGNGSGGITSVGLQPVDAQRLVVTNSPLVAAGNIGIDLALSGANAGTYNNPNVTVDSYGRVISIVNGPAVGTVTSVGLTAGPGVQVNGGPIQSSGNIVVTNTGVLRLTAGTGIDLSGSNGNVTVSVSGGVVGTVTSVGVYSTSLSISDSPVTTAGTIRIELPANPSALGTFTAGNLNTSGTLVVTGNANVGNIGAASGVFTSNITAGNIYANSGTIGASLLTGTLTTANQPNITRVGTLTSLAVTGNVTSGNANLGNTVVANYFSGSGQYLSAIQAANVAGTVANAANSLRVATTLQTTGTYYLPFISATANANYGLNSSSAFSANLANGAIIATTFAGNIAGANVTGEVGYAAVANSVAGANVSGAVAFATTANSVAGANVSGQVNYAAVANSVAGANVSGAVSSATNAGTVTTAAQGNITSAANLVSVGNITTGTWSANVIQPSYVATLNQNTTGYAATVSGSSQGNITSVGTLTSLSVSGALTTTDITTGSNTTPGTITGNWSLSAGSKLESTYADLAEYYEADDVYGWGTVVEFGGDKDITLGTNETTRVAGVVSKNPAYVMNSTCPGLLTAVALQGRVPCKILGAVRKGDIIVSAGSGYAKACTAPILGTIIGKSLNNFDGAEGIIEVAVGRL